MLDPAQGALANEGFVRQFCLLHPGQHSVVGNFSTDLLEKDISLKLHLAIPIIHNERKLSPFIIAFFCEIV